MESLLDKAVFEALGVGLNFQPLNWQNEIHLLPNAKFWLPYQIVELEDELFVEWCYARHADFSLPFVHDTIARLKRAPGSRVTLRTSISQLLDYAKQLSPSCHFAGLIFHISRCGSTLCSQLINQLPGRVCLSEPKFVDDIARVYAHKVDRETQSQILKSLLQIWLTFLSEHHQHCYIKLDAWLNFEATFLLSSLSPPRSMFLSRTLTEVIASHHAKPGAFTIPSIVAPSYFQLTDPGADFLRPDGYLLSVISAIYQAGLRLSKQHSITHIQYSQLPQALFNTLLADVPSEQLAQVNCNQYSKDSQLQFAGDKEKTTCLKLHEKARIEQKQHELESRLILT
ncbi:hypothetical protein ACFOEE_06655 [Pseudoalteromonas fenneropenaei]|uniref:Sulfotransferase family protein n=1 Tax=Pseudoalteromonas fenneropenaei TaxID=1737459 RepID=A0ABV7CHW3_9GAMM